MKESLRVALQMLNEDSRSIVRKQDSKQTSGSSQTPAKDEEQLDISASGTVIVSSDEYDSVAFQSNLHQYEVGPVTFYTRSLTW